MKTGDASRSARGHRCESKVRGVATTNPRPTGASTSTSVSAVAATRRRSAAASGSKPARQCAMMRAALNATAFSSSVDLRIQRVAQAVAQQVERKHQQEDRQARPDRHPRRPIEIVARCVEHAARMAVWADQCEMEYA